MHYASWHNIHIMHVSLNNWRNNNLHSGVGTNFGLGVEGKGVLGGVDQTNIMIISYKINEDRIHKYTKII